MNKHYDGDNIADKTETSKNSTEINSDRFVDNAPVLAGLIHDTPMGVPVAADGPVMKETVEPEAPINEIIDAEAVSGTNAESSVPLINHEDSENLRTRWNEIQGGFVDEPRAAVQQADMLVSEVIEKITQMFANERGALEGQWKQGDDVSTEDLRQALQHYRSFFNRLVS